MASRNKCDIPDCDLHYACRLRNKGLQISPRAQSTRTLNWRPTKSVPPAYNKQLMYSDRPDGSKMPMLKGDGTHMYRSEYDRDPKRFDANIRAAHQGVLPT